MKAHSPIVFLLVMVYVSMALRPSQAAQVDQPIPILAYYYVWFDESSWERAKIDYPLLGRYSSDDRLVMEQHIRWAQAAGIDGFIVSWKSTEKNDRRLAQLVELAGELDFKLAMIYQGLDFERDPLPAEQIATDFGLFLETYGGHPVFDLFGKPLMIWSGSWKISVEEIASVTRVFREQLLILSSERNVDGYLRLADLVEGNAYYWSSVDPETTPGYLEKLDAFGAAVHERGGLWIAPAAPGFDARLIGGTRVVERLDGLTFQQQLATAFNSAPDAIGVISWNEFSENTHVEPSEMYATRYLELLADFNRIDVPPAALFESDQPIGAGEVPEHAPALPQVGQSRGVAVVVVAGLALLGLAILAARIRDRS